MYVSDISHSQSSQIGQTNNPIYVSSIRGSTTNELAIASSPEYHQTHQSHNPHKAHLTHYRKEKQGGGHYHRHPFGNFHNRNSKGYSGTSDSGRHFGGHRGGHRNRADPQRHNYHRQSQTQQSPSYIRASSS